MKGLKKWIRASLESSKKINKSNFLSLFFVETLWANFAALCYDQTMIIFMSRILALELKLFSRENSENFIIFDFFVLFLSPSTR